MAARSFPSLSVALLLHPKHWQRRPVNKLKFHLTGSDWMLPSRALLSVLCCPFVVRKQSDP